MNANIAPIAIYTIIFEGFMNKYFFIYHTTKKRCQNSNS